MDPCSPLFSFRLACDAHGVQSLGLVFSESVLECAASREGAETGCRVTPGPADRLHCLYPAYSAFLQPSSIALYGHISEQITSQPPHLLRHDDCGVTAGLADWSCAYPAA